MAEIRIIRDYPELSETGCSFFLKKDNKTYITSTELRWLTVKKDYDSEEYFCEAIKVANDHINKCSNRLHAKLKMDVLLYKDPLKLNPNDHIVRLINAGADVRFKKMNNTVKICLSGKELFISYATNIEHVVNMGTYYVGENNNDDDPIIDYHKNIFDKDFKMARKITVNEGNLQYADKWYKRLKKNIEEITPKEIILVLIGALLGSIIFILEKLLS